jgi:RNA polymerase sigma-70 factor (ECF subfamily)
VTALDREDLRALLAAVRTGDSAARERLIAVVYPELHKLAAYYLRMEQPGHTLQTTALVHETYLRLFGGAPVEWQDRTHFFAVAARQMRRILVDSARARKALKGPGTRTRLPLEAVRELGEQPDEDLLALDEALVQLVAVDSRAAEVVELRFFAGLKEKEAAAVLGVSIGTVKRDWEFAKAWLFSRVAG